MSYFDHRYASNSDLKELVARVECRDKLDNIDAIFDFGSAFHAGILEPHKADLSMLSAEEIELIGEMSKTFWKDKLCSEFVLTPDFRREHEYYRKQRFGIGARCKVDGESKRMGIILELKGLSVTTYKSFIESIYHLSYDQGAAWYLNVTSSEAIMFRQKFFVGISKKQPDRLFKVLVDRNHDIYKSGEKKVKKAVGLWRMHGYE